jgi:DnaK suppressor protein
MKQEDIDFFKQLLTEQMEYLLRHIHETVSSLKDPVDILTDPADQASFDTDRNFMLRIRDRESKLIRKIKEALDRIEDGTFGICENCGEDISIGRLKARPVTTQCIECKTKEEALERVIGL